MSKISYVTEEGLQKLKDEFKANGAKHPLSEYLATYRLKPNGHQSGKWGDPIENRYYIQRELGVQFPEKHLVELGLTEKEASHVELVNASLDDDKAGCFA